MEKFTEKITNMLQETLSLYQALLDVLESEKKYIVEMDVAGVWAVTDRKKQLISGLEIIKEKIFDQFKPQLSQMEMDEDSFQVSKAINTLPISLQIKSELQKIILAIKGCKTEISLKAIENRHYVTEYLSVIGDIFSTVVNATDKKQYSHSGRIIAAKDKHHLIDAEV